MTNDKSLYRIEKILKAQTAIFAPNDICAMAVVDRYIGSEAKTETLVEKANLCDELLNTLESLWKVVQNGASYEASYAVAGQVENVIAKAKADNKLTVGITNEA